MKSAPNHDLNVMAPDQTLDGLTARLLTEIGEVIDLEKPARVIVQGDTATAMAGALAAYYRKKSGSAMSKPGCAAMTSTSHGPKK